MFKIIPILLFMGIAMLPYTGLSLAKSRPKQFNVNGVPFRVDLEVAASVRGDVKLEHGVYLFRVNCSTESCSLERISLNECVQDKIGRSSFTPKVDYWASWAGFLEANQLSDNVLELVIFQGTHHQLPAKMILTFVPGTPPFKQLKSFETSGFIDFRLFPDIDAHIDYVPLYGNQWKQLDCPVFLPGIK